MGSKTSRTPQPICHLTGLLASKCPCLCTCKICATKLQRKGICHITLLPINECPCECDCPECKTYVSSRSRYVQQQNPRSSTRSQVEQWINAIPLDNDFDGSAQYSDPQSRSSRPRELAAALHDNGQSAQYLDPETKRSSRYPARTDSSYFDSSSNTYAQRSESPRRRSSKHHQNSERSYPSNSDTLYQTSRPCSERSTYRERSNDLHSHETDEEFVQQTRLSMISDALQHSCVNGNLPPPYSVYDRRASNVKYDREVNDQSASKHGDSLAEGIAQLDIHQPAILTALLQNKMEQRRR